jgi:hypothetical protein
MFKRSHDEEPQASVMHALENRHKPDSNWPGSHGREPVTHHAGVASVHDAPVTTPPRLHDGERNAPMAKANAKFNAAMTGPQLTNRSGAIVASTKTS